jgi:hypothetical protein
MIILSLTVYQVVEIELHVHFSNQFIKPFVLLPFPSLQRTFKYRFSFLPSVAFPR